MIKVLGTQRIIILLVLIGINAALGSAAFLYLGPEKEAKERQLTRKKNELQKVQADIRKIRVDVELLKEQQDDFEELKARGFFNDQNRYDAKNLLDRVRIDSGVLSAVLKGDAGKAEESEAADKADHVLLVSPIEVSIEALQDRDVYRYIHILEKTLPGYLSVEEVKIERRSEITGEVLRLISSKKDPVLVQARVRLLWRTMIPKEEYEKREQGGR